MNKYKTIPYQIWEAATQNWTKYVYSIEYVHLLDRQNTKLFDKFMGVPTFYHTDWANDGHTLVNVPASTVDKHYMLASPHFRALLKAYEIKNGVTVYRSEQHLK